VIKPSHFEYEHDHSTKDTRLIDSGTLSLEASVSGRAERYSRGKTSHTVHVWWARRPHGTMRALVFASLMPSGSEGERVLRELPFAASSDAPVLKRAQRLLGSHYPSAPKVLDIFGGGGTIPYEAASLGAEVSSLDYNPLSVFIQKANLECAYDALDSLSSSQLASVVRDSGTRILEAVRSATDDLFPLRSSDASRPVFAYFWSYRLRCVGCGYAFLLTKRPWLSRKAGKRRFLLTTKGRGGDSVSIEDGTSDTEATRSAWVGRNGSACCPECQHVHKNPSIQNASDTVLAVGELLKKGKTFRLAPQLSAPPTEYLDLREAALLKALDLVLPDSRLPKWSGIVNPALYGIETHSDFLNRRQRLVVLELISALRNEHLRLQTSQPVHVVRFVVGALSALIDQLVDWNCRLSMWISQNEQVGRAFSGPGVPMLWDYVETDPLLTGPANLWDKLDRIVVGVSATPRFAKRPNVRHGKAQTLPFPSSTFDAILTDPPYYDNIYYSVLADFFYAWKRPILERLYPDIFLDRQCAGGDELVASQFRHGTHEQSHGWYCSQLTSTLIEASRVMRMDGILSFLFSHASLWGWDAIVKAFRSSGLALTSAAPLSIERRQRPRAMTSQAINTCVVFVARKLNTAAKLAVDIVDVEQNLRRHGLAMMPRLEKLGWPQADIGMAIFAQGVVSLANASSVIGVETDADALRRLGAIVRLLLPDFRLQARQSL
jgi:putative DNA methylase